MPLAVAFLAFAAGQAATHDRNKLTSSFNSSIAACSEGYDGVIVELVDPATGRRRMDLGTPGAEPKKSLAQSYLERLSDRVKKRGGGERRSLSDLLVVHATFSSLLDGFAATLDDTVLDVVLNDTADVLAIEANW